MALVVVYIKMVVEDEIVKTEVIWKLGYRLKGGQKKCRKMVFTTARSNSPSPSRALARLK